MLPTVVDEIFKQLLDITKRYRRKKKHNQKIDFIHKIGYMLTFLIGQKGEHSAVSNIINFHFSIRIVIFSQEIAKKLPTVRERSAVIFMIHGVFRGSQANNGKLNR